MLAYSTKALWPFLSPATLILCLLLLGGAGSLWRLTRPLARWLLAGSLLALLLVAIFPPAYWAIRPLEAYFPNSPLPERVDGIIVLGGAEQPRLTRARGQPHLSGGAERLLAFAELARRYPEARLVYTGGGVPMAAGDIPEAMVAEAAMAQMGMDMGRIEFERAARNTVENARLTHAQVQPKPGEVWLLITSAWHMPRSMSCFQAMGWPVLPYSVDYATMGEAEPWLSFSPLSGLVSLNLATHEWLGLVLYRLVGHTRSLLPER